ncbi:hypothetical protein, partial [Burkholderia sp. Ap-962]|uniref:hypothetical protein n=1 Tax=Burkholderia sp. Ap-962 TaxID=2608333 RepID=UPI001963E54F
EGAVEGSGLRRNMGWARLAIGRDGLGRAPDRDEESVAIGDRQRPDAGSTRRGRCDGRRVHDDPRRNTRGASAVPRAPGDGAPREVASTRQGRFCRRVARGSSEDFFSPH